MGRGVPRSLPLRVRGRGTRSKGGPHPFKTKGLKRRSAKPTQKSHPIKRLQYKGGKKLGHKAYVSRVRDMFEHMQ